ncbi:MAG: tryptophan-rich sensory protein [Clostridia bacterium]|nr:tryptophan-rich sensory protein [Clostridia bacterium]
MIVKFDLKRLIISLLIPLAAGGISAFITRGDMDLYETVERPPLSPPGIVFPIVWTVLYILMGVSLYLIWNNGDTYAEKSTAYILFGIQLFLNFIWSPVFFSARQYLPAFVILAVMWIAVLLMILEFGKIYRPAALLQIPYLVWLTIAGYLNMGVYLLNR